MAELLLEWFSVYGLPLMVAALVLGQLGVPIPTSILLLTVGAMLSDSVYTPITVFAMSVAGAAIGDQSGYWLGRYWGPTLLDRMRKGRYAHLVARAEHYSDRFGGLGVFITRWLVSPVGPYLNYVVGMTRLPWPTFTAMSLAGEALWIGLFLGLGHIFSQSIAATDDLLASSTWFIGAGIALLFLIRPFLRTWKRVSVRLSALRKSAPQSPAGPE